MKLPLWLSPLRNQMSRRPSAPIRRSHIGVELLEDRTVPNAYTVTTTDDAGPGSLRQAILDANANAGADTVGFAIGTGSQTIRPLTALPKLTGPTVIDGTAQPGFVGTPIIELDGSSAASAFAGVSITGDSTVRGLVINRFTRGISLEGNGNTLEGNYLGTDVSGTVQLSNSIDVFGSDSSNNVIGGLVDAARNVFSSGGVELRNSVSTIVRGNYFGTDASGTASLGGGGLSFTLGGSSNVIGGTDVGARNVFGGTDGVRFDGDNNVLQGNYIGVDKTGQVAFGADGFGVTIFGGDNNRIGGTAAGAGNVISGWTYGIEISSTGGSGGLNTATGNLIQGNFIGTNAAGTAALGSGANGIKLRSVGNTIGGAEPGAGNVISGNGMTFNGSGIFLENASANTIQGNFIGTNAAGTGAIPNRRGVDMFNSANNTFVGNVISGNEGQAVNASGAGNVFRGNVVGTDASGTMALGNGGGVSLPGGTTFGGPAAGDGNVVANNRSGGVFAFGTGAVIEGNTIRDNKGFGIGLSGANHSARNNTVHGSTGAGVEVFDGTGHTVRMNSISANGGLGINFGPSGANPNDSGDGDTGTNNLQNYPVIATAAGGAARRITGTLNSIPNATFVLDFYASAAADASGFGEGERYLGSATVITGADGNASFDVVVSGEFASGEWVTATATDASGNTSEFAWSVAATVNTAPVAAPLSLSTAEDTAVNGQVSAADADGDPLTFAVDTTPTHGTLTFNADGSFTYIPDADFNGTDTFTYKASDGASQSGATTVTITVAPINDAPVAQSYTDTTEEDAPLVVELTATDAEGDTITFTILNAPGHGTLTPNGDGTFTYTPDADFNGTDTFTFVANDGDLDSGPVEGTITITAVNDAPTADSQEVATDEDTPLAVYPTGSDPDGDLLTFTIEASPTHGTLIVEADGSLRYTPNENYYGIDTFTYKATDDEGAASAPVTVTITVASVNDAPAGTPASFEASENAPLSATLDGLGSDVDTSDALTYTVSTVPAHGTLVLNPDGSFTYTPDQDFSGTDSFEYVVWDGTEYSQPATVTITVDPDNAPPTADGLAVSTAEDIPYSGQVSATDLNAGDVLTYHLKTAPTNGTVVLNAITGSFTYTPGPNFNGTDTFTFVANDGKVDGTPGTVTATVTPVNDVPVADNQSLELPDDLEITFALVGSDVETASADLQYTITSLPAAGTVRRANNGVPVAVGMVLDAGTQLIYRLDFAFGQVIQTLGFTVTDTNGAVSPSGTVTFTTPTGPAGVVRIGGTDDNDVLAVTASGGFLRFTRNSVVTSIATIAVTAVRLFGRGGNDEFQANGVAIPAYLVGGTGNDTVRVIGTAGADSFVLSESRVTFGGKLVEWAEVETAALDAAGGTDTLTGANVTNTWALTGAGAGSLNGTVTFAGFETLVGGSGADTLTGANVTNTWALTGAGAGSLNTTTLFRNMEALRGGSEADTFKFSPTVNFGGTVDGVAGTDALDYSGFGAAVSADLRSATATGLSGFAGLESIKGSATTGDKLTGTDGENAWVVTGAGTGSVNGLGFTGFENLVGGSGTDTLTGSNATNTWALTGLGAGALNTTTLFQNIDELRGGSGIDTFRLSPTVNFGGAVDGGTSAPGVPVIDVLDYSGYTAAATVDLQAGAATGLRGFAGIETIRGSATTGDKLIGADGTNAWALTGTGAGVVNGTVTFIGFENLTGGSGTDTLTGPNATNTWLLTGPDTGSFNTTTLFVGFESLIGGTAVDTFTLRVGATLSGTIRGGAGADTLIGANDTNTWVLSGTNAGNINNDATVFAEIENLTGGTGADTFRFADGAGVTGKLAGGTGTDTLDYSAYSTGVAVDLAATTGTKATGVYLNTEGVPQAGGFSSFEAILGSSNADTLTGPTTAASWTLAGELAGAVSGISFVGFENLQGGGGNDTFRMTAGLWLTGFVNGGGGADTLIGPNVGANWVLTGSDKGAVGGLAFEAIKNLTGGSGADTFTVAEGGSWSGTLSGGTGTTTDRDTLTASSEGGEFVLTTAGGGTLNGRAFTLMENLAGGTGADTVRFNGGSVTGSIAGGGGDDTLDYNTRSTAVSINLETGTATSTGGFTGFEKVIGGTGIDTLIGPNSANTWTLDGANTGTVAGLNFRGIETLTGGTSNDIFRFTAGASVNGVIDGKGGFDALDYSDYNAAVSVNLATRTATGVFLGLATPFAPRASGFNGIESVTGSGTAFDVLTGPMGTQTWALGETGSGSVGGYTFAGFGALIGNTGVDTFTFGTSLWTSGTIDGGAGTNTLIGSNADRVWQVNGLNAGTAHGVGFTNIQNLTGGAGADTFIFADGQRVIGTVDGGVGVGAIDRLDFSAYTNTNAITINLQTTTVTTPQGTMRFLQIEAATGTNATAGPDKVIGANTANVWNLTGSGAGLVNSFSFAGFENLDGGSNTDAFTSDAGANSFGVLTGGLGTDTLTGANVTNTWVMTGAGAGSLNGTVTFAGFETLVGGSGSDILTGANTTNTWALTGAGTGSLNTTTLFRNMEALRGGSEADTFKLSPTANFGGTIDGGSGADVLDYSGFGAAATVDLRSATATGLTGFAGLETIKGSATTGDQLVGADGGNAWALAGAGAGSVNGLGFTGFEALVGGSGSDTLTGPNVTNTWALTGLGAGSLNTATLFRGMDELRGGSGIDTFRLSPTANFGGTIDGGTGAGADVLDYSGFGAAISVNLQAATATGLSGFTGLESLKGSAVAGDTLTGADTSNTWSLTGAGTGSVNGAFAFTGIENLNGGTQADTFKFSAGATVPGKLDGGTGRNVLDYSALTTPIVVDLGAAVGKATSVFGGAVGGVTNIQDVFGGSGNDTLTGDSGDNLLVGNAGNDTLTGGAGSDVLLGGAGADILLGSTGRDLLVGGTGADNLMGGNGEDILIGGSFAYFDEPTKSIDRVAIDAIMQEWRRTDVPFATVTANLQAGVESAQGSAGSYKLTPLTVSSDSASNTISGGTDALDWYFANSLDLLSDVNTPPGKLVTNI